MFADCQRCSEVLRDHIMRQKPNSARCTRDQPCDDCLKVLTHFSLSGDALWNKFDERAQHNRLKRARNSSDGAAGLGAAGVSVDASAPIQRPSQRAKFGRSSASVPGELYSSSPRASAAARSFGRLGAAEPPQRSNEFAALLASLHNQPFDATQAGIAARSPRPPAAGEASPRTAAAAAAAAAAASLPHMPTQVYPQPVRLGNGPMSDPGEGGTATEPTFVQMAPPRSVTPPLQLLQPAHQPNLISPQSLRVTAFDQLGSAAAAGEAAAMAMAAAAAAAQLQAQQQEMIGTDPATAQQGAL